jgi:hypothetical protein
MPFSLEHDLSEELLDNIISFSSRTSLTKLCRTSKKLNRIATPHLYSSGFLNGGTFDMGVKHLLPFTYLMFSSPSHASFVQSFAIRGAWGENAPVEKEEEDVDPSNRYEKLPWPKYAGSELEGVLKKKCTEYAVHEKEANELYEKIRPGANETMIVILLLANLPNLRKLDICIGIGEEYDDFFQLIDRVVSRTKPFDKLPAEIEFTSNNKLKTGSLTAFSLPMDILVTGINDKYPNSPQDVARIIKLPNVRSLYGWKMGDEGDPSENSAFKKLQPRSCPVECIELRSSKLHSDHLQLLMDATIPGKLKTFSYEIGCTWAWVDVEHRRIMKSLEVHHDTLECLALSHEEFYPYQFGNDNEKPDPVTFNSFKMLKKLKVAPVYIWGHEGISDEGSLKNPQTREWLWKGLPETLEELWIHRAVEQGDAKSLKEQVIRFIPDLLIPALELVAQYKPQAYPKLCHLRVEFQLTTWDDEWIEPFVSLCRQVEENGIRCMLILTDDAPDGCTYNDYPERGWGWNEEVEWQECIHNQEPPKLWIDVTKEEDLSKKLMFLKDEQKRIKQKLKEELEAKNKQREEEYAKKLEQERDAEDDMTEGGSSDGSSDGDEKMDDVDGNEDVEVDGDANEDEDEDEDEDYYNSDEGNGQEDEGNNGSSNDAVAGVDVKTTRRGTTYG